MHLSRDYSTFIADLGGYVWAIKRAKHWTWEQMAKELHTCVSTLHKLASGATRNPTTYTIWKIFKHTDNLGVIQHHQLEKFRGIDRATNILKFQRKVA